MTSDFIVFHFTLKDNLKKYDLVGTGHLANIIKNWWEQEIVSLICTIFVNSFLPKSLEKCSKIKKQNETNGGP